jgi:hypothetical protein
MARDWTVHLGIAVARKSRRRRFSYGAARQASGTPDASVPAREVIRMKTLARFVANWGFPIGLIVAWMLVAAYTVHALAQAVFAWQVTPVPPASIEKAAEPAIARKTEPH